MEEYSETLSETILGTLVKGKTISEETAERVRQGSHYYLPLFHPGKPQSNAAEDSAKRGASSGVQRYSGHSDATLNFIEASLLKLHDTMMAVELNRIFNAFEGCARQKDMGLFANIIDRPQVARTIGEANLKRQIGDFFDAGSDIEDDNRVIRMFMPGNLQDVSKREPIIASRNGDKITYIQLAPDLYEACLSLAPISVDMLGKTLGWLSQVSRMGALLSPKYFTNAITRDILGNRIQTTTPERSMILGYLHGAAVSMGQDKELLSMYIQSGSYGSAAQEQLGTILGISLQGYAKGLYETGVPGWKRTAKGQLVRVANTPLEALRVIEEASRMAEFEAVLKRDLAKIDLTLEGR